MFLGSGGASARGDQASLQSISEHKKHSTTAILAGYSPYLEGTAATFPSTFSPSNSLRREQRALRYQTKICFRLGSNKVREPSNKTQTALLSLLTKLRMYDCMSAITPQPRIHLCSIAATSTLVTRYRLIVYNIYLILLE